MDSPLEEIDLDNPSGYNVSYIDSDESSEEGGEKSSEVGGEESSDDRLDTSIKKFLAILKMIRV